MIYRGMVYAKMFYRGWRCFTGGWQHGIPPRIPSTRVLTVARVSIPKV